MGSVLWYLTHCKGQMSRFIQLSPKTICMINIENVIKVQPCEAGYWRWLLCYLALGGTIIGSWHVMPTHNDAIKVTPIESYLLQPPRHPHFLQKDYERHKMMVLFLTLLHHLVCAIQEGDTLQDPAEVPGMVCFGRRSWVCVYFVVLLCGYFDMWTHK